MMLSEMILIINRRLKHPETYRMIVLVKNGNRNRSHQTVSGEFIASSSLIFLKSTKIISLL